MGSNAPPLSANLPDDVAVCHGLIRELLATNHQQQRRIDQLEHRLDQLLKQVYGPRADKLNPDQLRMFGEGPPPDTVPPTPPPDPADEPMTTGKKKTGHGRRALPAKR